MNLIDPANSIETTPALLIARGIEKHFDGVYALQNAKLEVMAGEVHVLMGENGAGKSTLAKILAGVLEPDAGEIIFQGKTVRLRSVLHAQQLGIAIVFQELDLFPSLTVAENIVIGSGDAERGIFVDSKAMNAYCLPFLRQVGFTKSPATILADLSVGQAQLVAIARALAMNARLIFMDEPTSALGEADTAILFGLLRQLTARGVAIVYVSHKMQEIFQIADRITVMRDGAYIGTRRVGETHINEIITMMVGRELASASARTSYRTQQLLLSVRNLCSDRIDNISLDLHAGEVLGIAGLVGAGRSELGAALFGLDAIRSGSIQLNGANYHPRNARQAIERGLGLLPEDRKGQGLMMQMSVRDNCTLSCLNKLSNWGFIRRKSEISQAIQTLGRTRIKTASYDAPVSTLSGGNQQKVLLGRWLQVDPLVLFLDDPTRGIDVSAKRDIYEIISELASRGKGIIFVSSELPELLANCDRILVLHEGRQAGCLDAAEATQEQIMALATRQAVATSEAV